jgi:hypothetical protein
MIRNPQAPDSSIAIAAAIAVAITVVDSPIVNRQSSTVNS